MDHVGLELILEIQTDDFWTDISVELLEQIRRNLRNLVQLIEPDERKIVYTDFEDEIGAQFQIELNDIGPGVDKGRFRMKVRAFLEQHADHIAIQKLRLAQQLTESDIKELERMFMEDRSQIRRHWTKSRCPVASVYSSDRLPGSTGSPPKLHSAPYRVQA